MFDKLQKRAIKWILREQHKSYDDIIFLDKQQELDILPMKFRFIFSDLILFYRIIHKEVKIELPSHISKIEPKHVKKITRSSQSVYDGSDSLKYKTTLVPKIKCFKESYFVRTISEWNKIPFDIRNVDSLEKFTILLKEHLWFILRSKPDYSKTPI